MESLCCLLHIDVLGAEKSGGGDDIGTSFLLFREDYDGFKGCTASLTAEEGGGRLVKWVRRLAVAMMRSVTREEVRP